MGIARLLLPHTRVSVLTLALLFASLAQGAEPQCVRAYIGKFLFKENLQQLSIGQNLKLKMSSGQRLDVSFLGEQEGAAYFLDTKTEQILQIPRSDFVGQTSKLGMEPLLKIPEQIGATCAVHSTVNCLKRLNDLGGLHSPSLSAYFSAPEGEEKLFSYLEENAVSVTGLRRYLAQLEVENPEKSFDHITQTDLRRQVLERSGIHAKVTNSLTELEAHLSAGMPAILDVMELQISKQYLVNSSGALVKAENIVAPSANGSTLGGAHSVLAVALIDNPWMAKRVLVLDSSHGGLSLWKLSHFDAHSRNRIKSQYTLVYPGASPSAIH
jgi:hypothetical protein